MQQTAQRNDYWKKGACVESRQSLAPETEHTTLHFLATKVASYLCAYRIQNNTKKKPFVQTRDWKLWIASREVGNPLFAAHGEGPNDSIVNSVSPDSVTNFWSPSSRSLKTIGEPSKQLPERVLGADLDIWFSSCSHTFSGVLGTSNSLPLGSVNSIAYFSTIPVDSARECVQTVAMSFTGGGLGFPGTLKSTTAVQLSGSIVARTAHLSEMHDAINLFRSWVLEHVQHKQMECPPDPHMRNSAKRKAYETSRVSNMHVNIQNLWKEPKKTQKQKWLVRNNHW